jgi:hypothetical protein
VRAVYRLFPLAESSRQNNSHTSDTK